MIISNPFAAQVWGFSSAARSLTTIQNCMSIGATNVSVPFGTVLNYLAAAGTLVVKHSINSGATTTYNLGMYDGTTFTGAGAAPAEATLWPCPNSPLIGISVKNTSGGSAISVITAGVNYL
jgi:hypothetical protein